MSHPRVRQPVCVPTASSFCWFRLALCQRGPSSGRCSACGHAECQGVRAGSRASPRQDSPRTTSQSDGLSQALKPGPSDSGRLWALHLQAPDLPVHPEKRGCTRELQAAAQAGAGSLGVFTQAAVGTRAGRVGGGEESGEEGSWVQTTDSSITLQGALCSPGPGSGLCGLQSGVSAH